MGFAVCVADEQPDALQDFFGSLHIAVDNTA